MMFKNMWEPWAYF